MMKTEQGVENPTKKNILNEAEIFPFPINRPSAHTSSFSDDLSKENHVSKL